jgi:hypothetical protein
MWRAFKLKSFSLNPKPQFHSTLAGSNTLIEQRQPLPLCSFIRRALVASHFFTLGTVDTLSINRSISQHE